MPHTDSTPPYRKSDFKLGCMHGRVPTKKCPEAQIRNRLYFSGILVVHRSKTEETRIRLVGYEVPLLKRTVSRVKCVDLLGYDDTYKPWIIELKIGNSTDQLNRNVVPEIDLYATIFEAGVRVPIQNEICQRFLWPDFRFSDGLGKMILADRKFFEKQQPLSAQRNDILFCSFSRIPNEDALLKYPRAEIGLKIEPVLVSPQMLAK